MSEIKPKPGVAKQFFGSILFFLEFLQITLSGHVGIFIHPFHFGVLGVGLLLILYGSLQNKFKK